MRIVYAANRWIGIEGLRILLEADVCPVALLVPADAPDIIGKMRAMTGSGVLIIEAGRRLEKAQLEALERTKPDYLLSVHYPYILPEEVLGLPRVGALNLHPAYLPWNRGWHTPSWALIECTPMGATLHWMVAEVDRGDIAIRVRIDPEPQDTADSLYQKVLRTELDLLSKAIPAMKENAVPRSPSEEGGSFHRRKDLQAVQRLDIDEHRRVGDLIDLMRGLTTNDPSEAAYFEVNGKRYRIRVEIIPD